jgi:nucleoside-diphosphate-sugar epimerase
MAAPRPVLTLEGRIPLNRSILLAGASGAIGRRLAPLLVADGWRVVGTTRSESKSALLKQMGVEPAVVDVFDAAALKKVVEAVRPEVVIHQLTDLPFALEAGKMQAALERNARLRDEGTRNLVAAAAAVNTKRLVAQSIAFIYADGPVPHRESDPLLPVTHPVYGGTVAGVTSLEQQVLYAPLEGIVLRYGLFYGPGTGFDAPTGPGSVHVDAAARAAALAVTRGKRGTYNVAEADGAVSSDRAIEELGWDSGWRSSAGPADSALNDLPSPVVGRTGRP